MKKIDVLLVEDERLLREALADILEELGCSVVQAQNGRQALELFQAGNFDLVVTDNNMPVMDGLALIKEIRKLGHTQVLMMTGGSIGEHAAIEAGASVFFSKPVCLEKLEIYISKMDRAPLRSA